MSQYSEIMEKLADMDDTMNWCAAALLKLLGERAGLAPEDLVGPVAAEFGDLDLDDEDTSEFEHLAVRTPPRPKVKACPHNRQGIDDAGNLVCQRCDFNFTGTGSVQNRVGPNGGIVRDPNPPGWALEHSPGASSKNPGSPLVPHSG